MAIKSLMGKTNWHVCLQFGGCDCDATFPEARDDVVCVFCGQTLFVCVFRGQTPFVCVFRGQTYRSAGPFFVLLVFIRSGVEIGSDYGALELTARQR